MMTTGTQPTTVRSGVDLYSLVLFTLNLTTAQTNKSIDLRIMRVRLLESALKRLADLYLTLEPRCGTLYLAYVEPRTWVQDSIVANNIDYRRPAGRKCFR